MKQTGRGGVRAHAWCWLSRVGAGGGSNGHPPPPGCAQLGQALGPEQLHLLLLQAPRVCGQMITRGAGDRPQGWALAGTWEMPFPPASHSLWASHVSLSLSLLLLLFVAVIVVLRAGREPTPMGRASLPPDGALSLQLCGCGLLGVGIWLSVSQGDFATFSPSFPSLSAANLVIAIGTIVMVTGFLGCLGAIKENKCLLLSVSWGTPVSPLNPPKLCFGDRQAWG